MFLFSVFAFAQKDLSTQFIISDNTIGTVDMFKEKASFIERKDVYKAGTDLPENLKKFSFLADNGISSIKIKPSYKSLDVATVGDINKWHKLPVETPILLDGFEVKGKDTKIFSEILSDFKVVDFNGQKTLSIKTK